MEKSYPLGSKVFFALFCSLQINLIYKANDNKQTEETEKEHLVK